MIAVTDTGEGMDEATQARAFEPFFTTKGPGKGTGLGLSTVFGIVRQCGGAIRLRSERGAGTTFEVYLPSVGDAARRRVRSGPHQTVVRGTETILVVEDEPALRLVARKILENAGYTVLVASNGEEALTFFRRAVTPSTSLLTDVVMPGMSGPTLVGRVRDEGARTPILYTSGYADDALNRRRAGATSASTSSPSRTPARRCCGRSARCSTRRHRRPAAPPLDMGSGRCPDPYRLPLLFLGRRTRGHVHRFAGPHPQRVGILEDGRGHRVVGHRPHAAGRERRQTAPGVPGARPVVDLQVEHPAVDQGEETDPRSRDRRR